MAWAGPGWRTGLDRLLTGRISPRQGSAFCSRYVSKNDTPCEPIANEVGPHSWQRSVGAGFKPARLASRIRYTIKKPSHAVRAFHQVRPAYPGPSVSLLGK